jgi:hypothetical protein
MRRPNLVREVISFSPVSVGFNSKAIKLFVQPRAAPYARKTSPVNQKISLLYRFRDVSMAG